MSKLLSEQLLRTMLAVLRCVMNVGHQRAGAASTDGFCILLYEIFQSRTLPVRLPILGRESDLATQIAMPHGTPLGGHETNQSFGFNPVD